MSEHRLLRNEKSATRTPVNRDKPLPDHPQKTEKPPARHSPAHSSFFISYWTAPLLLFTLAFFALTFCALIFPMVKMTETLSG